MLSKKDIALLKGMFEVYKKDTVLETREETRALIAASEHRLETKIDLLRTDVAEMLDAHVLPMISDLDGRVLRLERRAKLA